MKTILGHRLLRLYIIPLGLLSGIYALFYLFPNTIVRNDLLDKLGINFPNSIVLLVVAAVLWVLGTIVVNKRMTSLRMYTGRFSKYEVIIVILLLSLFLGLFSYLAVKRHYNLVSGLYDFGLEHQVIWNTSEGRLFESSVEVSNYLGDHFSLLIVIPAIVYKIFPSEITLLVLQVLAVAISAAGIYLLAKKTLQSRALGLIFMLVFCFYFGVSGLMLFEFHPVAFGLPFLTWGLYLFETAPKRKLLATILFVLGALAKEEIGIFVGMYGFYRVFFKRDRTKTAIFLMIFGFMFSLAALFVFIPYFRGGVPADTLVRYKEWGDSGLSILVGVLTHPIDVIRHLMEEPRLSYIMRLLLSVGFLPLFAPRAALVALPNLMINALTSYPPGQTSGYDHYDSITSLVMVWAAILGFKNLATKSGTYKYVLSLLLFISLAVFLFHPIWRLAFMSNDVWQKDYPFVSFISKSLPKDAVIAASNSVGAHLGEYEHLQSADYDFDTYDQDPEYIFVNLEKDPKVWDSDKFKRLIYSGNYELILERNQIQLYNLKSPQQ